MESGTTHEIRDSTVRSEIAVKSGTTHEIRDSTVRSETAVRSGTVQHSVRNRALC